MGVFLGPLASPEDNWQPRISAVEHDLLSWRQRSLSDCRKALIINALALSRIWYAASLVHMPTFVLHELNQLVLKFFWRGKCDLVACRVVLQPASSGGFSVVDVELKVWALLLQWVRCLAVSPSTWVSFFSFRCVRTWVVSPVQVLSTPYWFSDFRRLPCFYRDLLLAWLSAGGCFLPSRGALSVGMGLTVAPVSSLTTKSPYSLLLIDCSVVPHGVENFSVPFGQLYWSTTWRQLFFFDIDRPVIDLSWKIAHGVLYTAERLVSFRYDIPTACFCGYPTESLEHLFFHCPLAVNVLSWLHSSLFRSSPSFGSLLPRHVLFDFSSEELLCVPCFFVYALYVCKFSIWVARNDFSFRNVRPGAIPVLECVKSRLRFHLPLFFRCFELSCRCRCFARQWCANGVVGSVHDGRLVLSI